MRPFGGSLVDGKPNLLRRAELVAHCLLVETDDGLVLIDTGFGTEDVLGHTVPRSFRVLTNPTLDLMETAARQIAGLGHSINDVRHIILTHLDLDHAGGLRDFPKASVHVFAAELTAASERKTAGERNRYLTAQWSHGPDWRTYDVVEGDEWFGFQAVRKLDGLPEDFLIVPLAGHTRGHAGVAVRNGDKWLLHAGDAYFFHGQLAADPHIPPGLKLFEAALQTEKASRLSNQDRLRSLVREHGDEVDVFSAHDKVELDRYS